MIPDRILLVSGTSWCATLAVDLGRDGVNNGLHFSQLLLEVLDAGAGAVLVDPIGGVLDGGKDSLLVVVGELATETFLVTELALEAVDVGREGVEGFDTLALGFILSGELLGVSDHSVDLLLRETALLVLDGDGFGLATTSNVVISGLKGKPSESYSRSLIGGRDLHDTVGVNLEGDFDLRNATRSGGDTGELEFAEEIVVLGEGTFTLEDLDQDGRLVVSGGREAKRQYEHAVKGDQA